ncbi:hypothetical protein JHK82_012458 [Glycine max]|nr:hypothetical protein JHK85_012813 [Glycine max]KAG5057483.1 hypothetical protein JHK86_012479 [Glycine max]KAG5154489.1 hypothetical protein JHK82_012458 [Glycine max]
MESRVVIDREYFVQRTLECSRRFSRIFEAYSCFIQLASGTNAHTIDGLKKRGTLPNNYCCSCDSSHVLISGIAYGGYARKIIGRVLRSMQSQHGGAASTEDHLEHLLMALKEALALVVLNVYDR